MKEETMRIDIFGLSFKLTDAIVRHVRRRVGLALAPLASASVRGATVRLRDINGTRGGVDKGCRIIAWLRDHKAVIVDSVDRDLYAAVDAAVAKLKQGVWRQ